MRRIGVDKPSKQPLNQDGPLKDNASDGHIGPGEAESSRSQETGIGIIGSKLLNALIV